MNPADAASWGMKVGPFLKFSTGISGPDFLIKPEVQWPAGMHETSVRLDADPEMKSDILLCAAVLKEEVSIKQENKWNSPLTTDDLSLAEKATVSFVQRKHGNEMAALSHGAMRKSSLLHKLEPVLADGVFRVCGGLSKSAMPEDKKNPAILPKESHVPKPIHHHMHEKVGHRGRNHMLSTLQRHYWIPHANTAARKVIRGCMVCQRQWQKPGEQKMSDLPIDRISADLPPLTHVGVDYFGPMEVKRGRIFVKRYWAFHLPSLSCSTPGGGTIS